MSEAIVDVSKEIQKRFQIMKDRLEKFPLGWYLKVQGADGTFTPGKFYTCSELEILGEMREDVVRLLRAVENLSLDMETTASNSCECGVPCDCFSWIFMRDRAGRGLFELKDTLEGKR